MSILTQALRHFGRQARQAWLSAFLSNSCLLCGADAVEVLCPGCIGDLPPLPEARCPQCAEPTSRGERCGHCLGRPPHFDAAIALYPYAFPMDRLIHAFKYGGQLALAGWLGKALAEAITGVPLPPAGAGKPFSPPEIPAHAREEVEIDLILPLPLHPERLRLRGYNQSAELALAIARRLGRPVDRGHCQRTRATPPQAGLPLGERQANVRGAFECTADFSGKRLLLVDDVMTTGATLDECARTLKLHGAPRVTVAVAARALRQN